MSPARIFPLAILFLTTSNQYVSGEREHKVHNIVLYPERHSWCQTTPIKQIVAMPGYEPVTIDNNVCVGACYSYSIPKTQPAEPGELIGPYCDSCQPLEIQCYHVTLTADDGLKTIQKRVQIITNCSCSSCNKEQAGDCEISEQNTLELPTNLFSHHAQAGNGSETSSEAEIPELLNLSHSRKPASPLVIPENATHQQHYKINSNLINLLKSIQDQEDDDDESNFNYDKDQLKELLEIIEGSEHELSYQNLMNFVNFVNVHNSENLELDLSKLKEVLMNFKKDQNIMEKHREFGLGIDLDNLGKKHGGDINGDIDDLTKKYSVGKNFGLEGSHLGLGHRKGSHIGMGIQLHSNLDSNRVDSKSKIDSKTSPNFIDDGNQKKIEIDGGKGHHHLGESQHIGLKLGHLIHGPHGSLVLAPDGMKVEEKLNLESEEVSPNHEGVVLSYENHRVHHDHHKRQSAAGFK